MTFRISIAVLTLSLMILAGDRQAISQGAPSYGFDLVDKTGNIRKPADYRDRYQALGTFSVADLNGDTELHYTYASPGTAEYYRKTGKYADGTVLVKEVFGTDHAQLTTGDAHWASGTKVWFVMIRTQKDATQATRFGVTVGDGLYSSPTRLTSRSRLITRKTARAAISRLRRQIGSTFRVIQFSIQSKQQVVTESNFRKHSKEILMIAKVFGNRWRSWPGGCKRISIEYEARCGSESRFGCNV